MSGQDLHLALRRTMMHGDWIAAERVGRRLARHIVMAALRRLWGGR
jgi:hypothetical protein